MWIHVTLISLVNTIKPYTASILFLSTFYYKVVSPILLNKQSPQQPNKPVVESIRKVICTSPGDYCRGSTKITNNVYLID